MKAAEITAALTELGFQEDVWLHNSKPWEKIAKLCTESTFQIYFNPEHDYKFNSTLQILEIAYYADPNRKIMRVIDYDNITCFNGTYYMLDGVPQQKNYR